MDVEFTEQEAASRAAFREFVLAEIVPHADRWDREERIPAEFIARLRRTGYLGALVPAEYGGTPLSMIGFGLLNEELGRGCSSVRSLLTVHGMVQFAIARWGSRTLKERWLGRLASGDAVGAFCLTEAGAGSDASAVETTAIDRGGSYVLSGTKRWITFGQIASVFLVFARRERGVSAILVERDRPGVTLTPIGGVLGTRASMLATVGFDSCEVPRENRIGGDGFGLSAVATSALDIGRYSVACGCVGIGQASLDASVDYASRRRQFGALLRDHQLVRKMITEMAVNVSAARWLCCRAGHLKEQADPRTMTETLMAKYFASRMAVQAAADAVQIHGAHGCGPEYSVQRYFRDAKVMEIIEGSTQLQEIMIAQQICGAGETA